MPKTTQTKKKIAVATMGDKVKCNLTGFTGIVKSQLENFNGNIMLEVSPKCKDNKVEDGYFIDRQQLAVVTKQAVKPPENLDFFDTAEVKIGDKVKSKANNQVGVVTDKVIYFNGCISFRVELDVGKDNKSKTNVVSEHLLKVVKKNYAERPNYDGEIPKGGSEIRSEAFKL